MIYFTSDLHFYHEKIIKHTHRPFHTVEEMNKALIKKWNDKISSADEVYILGDFTMKGADIASALLYSLKGKKYLVRGNHDNFVDSAGFDQSLFASIQDYMEITYLNTNFVLFHYPIAEWHGYGRGEIALHGHQHNHEEYNIKNRKDGLLRYDVGVDANDMAPVSAEEIIDFFYCR
ncbi:MAG: metallophosphoesterase [Lachnospiraceae bacterium]|nr:metallophosphoesterase [Lachnospiraceae bacterium]